MYSVCSQYIKMSVQHKCLTRKAIDCNFLGLYIYTSSSGGVIKTYMATKLFINSCQLQHSRNIIKVDSTMKLFVCLTKKEKLHKSTLKNLLQGHYAKGFKPGGLPQVS